MKTLQNDFTTPEQSKRLLELGVPADSADMIWDGVYDYENGWEFENHPSFFDETYSELQKLYREEDSIHILPCWSVGRLIEIYLKCNLKGKSMIIAKRHDPIGRCLYVFENEQLDFSKLEE